jgi:hypothetical protein
MKGCGGLRKIRVADPKRKKGKRGGARVIYLHIPEVDWIYLFDVYGKHEREDLTSDQEKELKQLAEQLRAEAIRMARTTEKENE